MSKLKKIILGIFILLLLTITYVLIFSPYKYHDGSAVRMMKYTIDIKATPDSVFRFLGNSNNARRWSVFVHHISSLNSDSITDGTPGSRRRCFCDSAEMGTQWDETITEVIPNQKRRLICYDFKHFSMTTDGLTTEQVYKTLPDGNCRLSFSLFVDGEQPSFFERMKIYVAAFRVQSIFERNVQNVKAICEGNPPVNPHE
ncbi:MAG: SRPBCC family protein [Flavobacteriia bacterium]|nr:SRPBCC family protein [Flavobacteriia bacterium]